MRKFLLIILSTGLLCGCASTYKPIKPKAINYAAHSMDGPVSFSYHYDVLSEAGNKKYAKREKTKNLKLVAVRISNYSGRKLNITQDLAFYCGNREIFPCSPGLVKNELKQGVAVYLLYMLLTPLNLYVSNSNNNNGYMNTEVKTYRVGLILGPAVTIGNLATSGTANANFYDELQQSNIVNKEIENGETIYGLVGFREIGYDPLTLELRNK